VEDRERLLLTKWISELRIIHAEVRSLLLSSKIFWEVQKILEANPEALCHRLFNDWMATNYAVATAIGIRRQIDVDSRSVSMKGLLLHVKAELACRSDLLSRENFIANYRPELASVADSEFDRLVGGTESRVEVPYIQRDLDKLDTVTAGVKHFANKRIAHRDAKGIEKRKLGELDDCLEVLAEMVDRYARIMAGSGSDVLPDLPSDWKCVFETAWIK